MGAPITSFEIVESIRFLGALASTEGISEPVKKKANEFIETLMGALQKDIDATVQSRSDIKIVKGKA